MPLRSPMVPKLKMLLFVKIARSLATHIGGYILPESVLRPAFLRMSFAP